VQKPENRQNIIRNVSRRKGTYSDITSCVITHFMQLPLLAWLGLEGRDHILDWTGGQASATIICFGNERKLFIISVHW